MAEAQWYKPTHPDPDLSTDLVTGWFARTDDEHDLVPDACVDVMWVGDGTAWLCGPETSGWTFALPNGVEATGVRFRPGRAGSVLGFDASDVCNQRVPLEDLLGSRRQRCLVEEVAHASSPAARLKVLQRYARSWLSAAYQPDAVADRVARILRLNVNTTVRDLASATGLSERQLNRRCTAAFGYGPATLRRILRLQGFLRLGRHPAAPASLSQLAAVAGYADQQHLAQDSRSIARATPSALLRRAVSSRGHVRFVHDT